MDHELSGKLVWITGASSGIGEQMAYVCSQAGAHLILSSRNLASLEAVRDNCKGPGKRHVVILDLGDSESVQTSAQDVLQRIGTPHLLIHNGGVSQRSYALETSMDVHRRIMEVNFFGPVLLSKLVVPEMIKRKSGRLIVISSLAGKWGFYERSSYSASKHALHGFFETLRLETEKQGIQISIATPGFIATNISVNAVNAVGKSTGEMDQNQSSGMPPDECARIIILKSLQGIEEFGVGGKEIKALPLHRYFPKLFGKILRKQAPR